MSRFDIDPNSARSPEEEAEQRVRLLMMAALDDEIDEAGRRELDAALESNPEAAAEWQRFNHLQEVTRMTQIAQPPDAAFAGYWQDVYNRLERGTAWILISFGALIVGAWGLWHAVQDILADTTTPMPVKIGLFALLFGGLVLALSVAREKLTLRRTDPFKEVEK